ncbi:MAG: enoyl-CoA hydratase/isomerase family protein [Actinomycetes bacterium]
MVVLTLVNGKVNPLCVDLLNALEARCGEVSSGARAVVITGGARVFAAGADITEFAERGGEEPFALSPPDRVGQIGAAFLGALNAVAALPCPTIAAVAGVALGGGCELALACDFRLAGSRAKFGQPEILLGIIPGGGGTQRLARLIGSSRAKELIFTGRMIDVSEAQQLGLVDRVTEDDDVTGAAVAWASEFAAGPAHALALAKAAVDHGLDGTLGDGLELEQQLFVQSFTTPDAAVGVRSFLRAGPGKATFNDA